MKNLYNSTAKKNNNLIEKWAKRLEQTFLQKRFIDGQKAHEKMLNITDYQRDANQNYYEIPPHNSLNGHHQKATNKKCWRVCGEKGTLPHCLWACKLVQPPGRTVQKFLKKLKIELPHDPAILLLGIYPEETKTLM